MYEEACEVLVSEGKFKEVYQVYSAQGSAAAYLNVTIINGY